MQKSRTWLGRNRLGLAAFGAPRCLVLIVVLVFAVSGFTHASAVDHVSAGTPIDLTLVQSSAANVGDGEPCCSEHTGKSHASDCSVAGGCSLCAPVVGYVTTAPQPEARSSDVRPDDAHIGRAPSPQFRPPKLSVNA